MTLEERLLRSLRCWRKEAMLHRAAMEDREMDPESDEFLMHSLELELCERVVNGLASDLAASAPAAPPLPRRVEGDGDDLTPGPGPGPVTGQLPDVGADV